MFAFYEFVGRFVNIFWKILEHFTVGCFREGRSDYDKHNFCYFINMRICLHRWGWMGAGFFFIRKMFETSFLFFVSKL